MASLLYKKNALHAEKQLNQSKQLGAVSRAYMIHSPLDPYEQATTIAKYQPDPSIYLDHVYHILELDSSTENTDLNT